MSPLSNFNDAQRGLPFYEETITNVLISEFENGVEQRRDKWGKTKKRFTITFKVKTKVEVQDIRDYFTGKSGPLTTFSFTNPIDEVTYTVRFVENSLTVERQHYSIYNIMKVELIEVF